MVVVNLKLKDRLCYSFCQDLGNKEFHALGDKLNSKGELDPNGKIIGLDKKINLKWSLFRVKQLYDTSASVPTSSLLAVSSALGTTPGSSIFEGGSVKLPNSDIYLPGNFKVEKVKEGNYNFFDREKSYNVFIAPSDYSSDGRL